MTFTYMPEGICPWEITLNIEDGIISAVEFTGGCDGNLKAIGKLVAGRPADEVRGLLAGITCEHKPTSCADQLSKAICKALDM